MKNNCFCYIMHKSICYLFRLNSSLFMQGALVIMDKYVCDLCGYEYICEMGDVENGIEPMTPFEELPEGWVCPWCGAGKEYFLKTK